MELKNKLSTVYITHHGYDREKAYELINFILEHTEKYSKHYFQAKINLGLYYKNKFEFNEAVSTFNQILDKIEDNFPDLKINTLLNLNSIIHNSDVSTEINHYLNEAIVCTKSNNIKDFNILINNHLGINYSIRGKFERSVEYFKKALKQAKKKGDIIYQYRSAINLANIFMFQGKYNNALTHIKSVLHSIQITKEYPTEIAALQNLSVIYLNLKKYKISEEYADKAVFLSKYLKDNVQFILSLIFKINIHFEQMNIDSIKNIYQVLKKLTKKMPLESMNIIVLLVIYKADLLLLLNTSDLKNRSILNRIMKILNNIDSDINSIDDVNIKAELSFLYCQLHKYIFDFSTKKKVNLFPNIIEKTKPVYAQHLRLAKELYSAFYSNFADIYFKNRLKEIETFPVISNK